MNQITKSLINYKFVICLLLVILILVPISLDFITNDFLSSHLAYAQGSDVETNTEGSLVSTAEALKLSGWQADLYWLLISIGTMFAWAGGWLLDVAVVAFAANMATVTGGLEIDKAIDSMWSIVRDLFNLLFIFGLIYIGFRTILNSGSYDTKRTLSNLLVAALLINFSLFVSQVIVDFGNVTAYQISQLMTSESERVIFENTPAALKVGSISDTFVAMTTMENFAKDSQTATEGTPGGKDSSLNSSMSGLVVGFLSMFMLIVLGFVFAAGALVLFTRFIALIIFMIFSPAMFLPWVFPAFASYGSVWWNMFLRQVLVGPAYLFMLYLSLRALEGLQIDGIRNSASLAALLVYFLLVIGFAWAALTVARSLGAVGAGQAINFGRGARRRVGNLSRSAAGASTGFAGRWGVGWAAQKWNEDREKKGKASTSVLSRVSSDLANRKYGGAYSRQQIADANRKADVKKARYDQIYGAGEGLHPRKGGIVQAVGVGYGAAAGSQERIDMERAITGADNDQIIELLSDSKPGSTNYDSIVANMSDSQYEAVMKAKPEVLDDTAKSEISESRKEAIIESIKNTERAKDDDEKSKNPNYSSRSTNQLVRDGIKNVSDAQLKVMGSDNLVNFAADLKQSQFDDIMKNKDYTPTEKARIKKAREDELWSRFESNHETFFKNHGQRDKEVAKLPKKILMHQDAASHFSKSALKQMVQDDAIDQSVREEIKKNLKVSGSKEVQNWLSKSSEGRLF